MGFDVAATSYDRFMGRWSVPLAREVLARLDPRPGQRALDVGCGPGAMTAELAARLGEQEVTAVDPSPRFVSAVAQRLPGVAVHAASAERLPFPDDSFDVTVAGLVVHFMADPGLGVAEMTRVTRPGGRVAATVWDHAGGRGPVSPFWSVVRQLDPAARGEAELVGSRGGQLLELGRAAGLEAEEGVLTVHLRFATFADWWEPFTLGVGPAGDHVAGLEASARSSLEEALRTELGDEPIELDASAWFLSGRVPLSAPGAAAGPGTR